MLVGRPHPDAPVALDAGQPFPDVTQLLQNGPLLVREHGQHSHEWCGEGREQRNIHAAAYSPPTGSESCPAPAGIPVPRKPSIRDGVHRSRPRRRAVCR